ncbi:hypothetical protein [Robiginitalea biformata]|uniref:Uncharacterized protein n=1 Tax=Robiginitalea biformata (strain ATCC BAA-864 / DSM 15991 / KCTC 12146 / HTCC2501) TaxID=313596 RepID=A4CNR6_ROBBH|nr:hypothetical protein [Robiginitalea biformata]EAR14533.1 hypothetical protein RB2501_00616 [Robiginitalea biformata HTCC2501]
MEILLFSLGITAMALSAVMVYQAHHSLQKTKKAERQLRMKH